MNCASIEHLDGDITWSQPEGFFLFFPTLTGVFVVGGGLPCICGVSIRTLSLSSLEGVPLTLVGVGEETTPIERVGTPFTPFERGRGGALLEAAAVGRLCQRSTNQRHGARTNL